MNLTEALTLVGLLLALTAAGVALWQGFLLRKQVEDSRKINEVELYFRVASIIKDLDIFFVDRPDMRPYFYENKRLPISARQRRRVEAASEMLCDLAESVIACGPGLGVMAVDWHKYFSFLYQNSEALRAYWDKYSYYYPNNVREAFGASVQKMPPSYIRDQGSTSRG